MKKVPRLHSWGGPPGPQPAPWPASGRAVTLAYACIGTLYLLYLPDALPVLDDWMYLRLPFFGDIYFARGKEAHGAF